MSQSLVGGRGVTASSRAGSAAIVKTTCDDCKRTVLIATVDGKRVALDTELIAVVPRRRSGQSERVVAHRVHGELCLRYQYEADKEKRRKALGIPPSSWRRIDNTKRTKQGTKRGARTSGM